MEWAKRAFHRESLLSAEVPVRRTDCVGSRVGLSRPRMHMVENIRDKDEASIEGHNKREFSDAFCKGQTCRKVSGWTASRPDRRDPAWVGWHAREEGRTQLWDKKQAFLLLEIYIAGLSSQQVWQVMHSPSTQNCHFLKFSGTLRYWVGTVKPHILTNWNLCYF